MTTSQRLVEATKDIWAKYNEHPFVLGIQNGTLDIEKFRYYIVQDYMYLEDYTKSLALGVAKAKSADTLRLFSKYINVLINEEMDIHWGYMGKFAVTREEIDSTPRALDNLSYTSYMLRVSYEEGEAEVLASILSCAYSYEVIAKKMVENNPKCVDHEFYGEWVRGYASEHYSKENEALMNTLDRLTENYSEEQLLHLIDIFTACSRYELAFWEMAWNMSK